ncbi:MAG: L,D-transpeptidase family protein [Pseudomonadota bacterium]
MRLAVLAIGIAALGLGACSHTPTTDDSIVLARADAVFDDLLPSSLATSSSVEKQRLTAFYLARSFAPVWHGTGEHAAAREAAWAELERTLGGMPPISGPPVTTELALSEAALRYAQVPAVDRAGADAVAAAALTEVAAAVDAAQPAGTSASVAFGGQGDAIERYRAIAAAGGWSQLPGGKNLEPGATDPRLPLLRERLERTGDLLPRASSGPVYDAVLVAAVKAFQNRHGLSPDGVVGPGTLRALNVSADARLAQLQLAERKMEAISRQLGERYVLVNVPAYELAFASNGAVVHRARVVTGSKAHQTPIFSDRIEYLVFNPGWSVPASIAGRSLLPKFKADPQGMAAKGYRLVGSGGETLRPTDVDWSAVSAGSMPYRVRQSPGRANALGAVKFMFPNDHAVYLHDTPSKSYFDRSMRALSNGCVRVDDPMVLAEHLLSTDGWDRSRIDAAVASGRSRTVHLDQPVPVHLVYVTAWVDEQGQVQFRDDVYRREARSLQVAAR